ncbi:uncharacterized protein B0P05DRAFT_547026 [Gilbertella persicaria]|uniref:uncharacterized protein n=1 Tax=Gilbertella persicaria TaxID=101096 RepID=UPI00221F06A9|nr:uncharacterized protein B0P05DRAFT_547026 [Gilbertella persicaria]KAI8075938.1 hypothetical protein B0P05DRAFT_547026 [Gilbertella persicaria]
MGYHEEAYESFHVEAPTEEHKSNWTHQALAAAAGFAAMRAFDKKKEEGGEEDQHALAKELLAGLAAASVDHLVETKGLDWADKQKAKKQAEEEARKLYSERTGYEF